MSEYEIDPDDGLPREIVGSWVEDKHSLLAYYIDSSRAPRAKVGGEPCFVDLFCGPSRVRFRDTNTVRDGSAIVAVKAALHPSKGKAAPFSHAYVADLEAANVAASVKRIERVPFPVSDFVGTAEKTASEVASALPKRGLHLAFLDPYDLSTLSFSIIRTFSRVPNVDLVIHFSSGDMKRNLEDPLQAHRFEAVAPGWCEQSHLCGPRERRRRFFEYWSKLVADCGYHLARRPARIRNRKRSEMYLLTVASKHPLGQKLWDSFRVDPQIELLA